MHPIVGQYAADTDAALQKAASLGIQVALPLGIAASGAATVPIAAPLAIRTWGPALTQSIFGPMDRPYPGVLAGAVTPPGEDPELAATKTLITEIPNARTRAQRLRRVGQEEVPVKWAIDPRNNNVLLKEDTGFYDRHLDWFPHLGLPSAGETFDRIPRGNVTLGPGPEGPEIVDFNQNSSGKLSNDAFNQIMNALRRSGYLPQKKPGGQR